MRSIRIAGIIVAIAAVTWLATRPTLRSAALLMDMTGAASGVRPWIPVGDFDVTTEDLQAPTRHGPIAARLYRTSARSAPALVVVPGVHGGGVDEPRLAALSRRISCLLYTSPSPRDS